MALVGSGAWSAGPALHLPVDICDRGEPADAVGLWPGQLPPPWRGPVFPRFAGPNPSLYERRACHRVHPGIDPGSAARSRVSRTAAAAIYIADSYAAASGRRRGDLAADSEPGVRVGERHAKILGIRHLETDLAGRREDGHVIGDSGRRQFRGVE